MHRILPFSLGLPAVLVLCLTAPVGADQADTAGAGVHRTVNGVVSKIVSGVVFVRTPVGLRPRTISPSKADRLGLHEAKAGDEVVLWVDEGNVLLDAHPRRVPPAGHRLMAGTLDYADPYWQEIRLSTPEGGERLSVDPLAGSKLSMFSIKAPVVVELDEDNVVIDIHRSR
ncbi:hypothetical protein [Nitrospira sp. Kam-Ns4a]